MHPGARKSSPGMERGHACRTWKEDMCPDGLPAGGEPCEAAVTMMVRGGPRGAHWLLTAACEPPHGEIRMPRMADRNTLRVWGGCCGSQHQMAAAVKVETNRDEWRWRNREGKTACSLVRGCERSHPFPCTTHPAVPATWPKWTALPSCLRRLAARRAWPLPPSSPWLLW